MGIDADLYPVGLIVAGQPCLVVGGGRVAARKIAALLSCGAAVTVVAPEAHVATRAAGRRGRLRRGSGAPIWTVHLRPYRAGEAAGYRLVVTATGDPVGRRLGLPRRHEAGVWVNSADDPEHCSFVLPAVTRDGPVTVAVSTGGSSPALASWLRRRIGRCPRPRPRSLAALLDDARRRIHARGASTETVDWHALLDGPLPDLVRRGEPGRGAAVCSTTPSTVPAGAERLAPGTPISAPVQARTPPAAEERRISLDVKQPSLRHTSGVERAGRGTMARVEKTDEGGRGLTGRGRVARRARRQRGDRGDHPRQPGHGRHRHPLVDRAAARTSPCRSTGRSWC